MGKPLIFGGAAALLGAVAWGLLIIYANLESGWLAWGIGGAVGFAIVKGDGHGTLLAMCAGVLALLSIFTGKNISYRVEVDEVVEMVNEGRTAESHTMMTTEAAEWQALGDSPDDAAIRSFAEKHSYDLASGLTYFRSDMAPQFEWFTANKPTLADWRSQTYNEITESYSFTQSLVDDFHPLDILFALLGIGTAFGLVQKETTERLVAARKAERHERDAAAENSAPAAPSEPGES